VASGRKRKNTILSLEQWENTIEGDENLLAHATEYYSKLFGPAPEFNIQINETLWEGAIRLSESDNDQLCRPFSETEIWNALSQMEKNKAAALIIFQLSFTKLVGRLLRLIFFSFFLTFIRAGWTLAESTMVLSHYFLRLLMLL
jgi:hypothetical protein